MRFQMIFRQGGIQKCYMSQAVKPQDYLLKKDKTNVAREAI